MKMAEYREREDYIINDKPLNLATMEMKTMRKVKLRYPDITTEGMANILGISVNELSKKVLDYNLDENYEYKGLDLNQLEINLIKRARVLFPDAPITFLADKIGMTARTLHRNIKDNNLLIPKAKTLKNRQTNNITSLQLYRPRN